MEILIRNQNKAVLLSILLGLFIGLVYDVFKMARKLLIPQTSVKGLFKKREAGVIEKSDKTIKNSLKIRDLVVVALFDLAYGLLLCPVFCIFTYITINGQFRWFIFAAAFLGALMYKITLGRLVGVAIDSVSYAAFCLRRLIFDKIKIPLKKLSTKIISKRALKRQKREEIKQKNARRVVFSYGKF